MATNLKYYLLQYSPRFHQSTLMQLNRLGVRYYCPVMRTVRIRKDCCSRRELSVPMFPGYVFVLLDFERIHPSCFSSMRNVSGLVRFCDTPAEVPVEVIQTVKAREQSFSSKMTGVRRIDHRLAEILLLSDSSERSCAFADYVCNRKNYRMDNASLKEKKTAA